MFTLNGFYSPQSDDACISDILQRPCNYAMRSAQPEKIGNNYG